MEEGIQIGLDDDPSAVYIMYIKEEVLSSDDDGFGENDVQQALLEEARNQLGEGDTVEIFMEEEQLSCSGVGISENRDEQASLQEVRNQINYIENENCVEVCRRGEVVAPSCSKTEMLSSALSSPVAIKEKYFSCSEAGIDKNVEDQEQSSLD